jgi:hypothetical protein
MRIQLCAVNYKFIIYVLIIILALPVDSIFLYVY